MIEWTNDQKRAIETRGRGIIVSAAAGSGKTAVLVERTLRILCDEDQKTPADGLLAVTFTKDAASQMKQKLFEALEKRLAQDPHNEWLISQRTRLSLATITTINSFCYDLVRNHIHEFDFESGVTICDENDDKTILDECITKTIEEFYECDPSAMEFLYNTICSSDDSGISDCVLELHRFFSSIPFKQDWIDVQRQRYKTPSFFDELADKKRDDIISKLEYLNEQIKGLMQKAETLQFAPGPLEVLKSDSKALTDIISDKSIKQLDELSRRIGETKFATFKGLTVTKGKEYPPEFMLEKSACAAIKNSRDEIKGQFCNLLKTITATREQTKRDIEICSRIFEELIKLEARLCENIHEVKVSRNVLSFSDVEHMAVELLLYDRNTRTPLCEELVRNEYYKVILIDEFQDVNNMQDLIFKALSQTDDLSVIGKNVFVVGDMKQSIYRFRLSNPNLFDGVRKCAVDSDRVEEIDLLKNFRSRSALIDAVNYFFKNLMTYDLSEIDYADEKERLVAGATYDQSLDDPVEVDIITEKEKLPEYLGFDNEHLAIANRISQLINEGSQVEENGRIRSCVPGDFCILTRSHSPHKSISKALRYVGIKSSYESTDGYLKSREISVILNFLRVIDNPLSDIPLLSVMLSPIMMFSPDETAQIRNLNKSIKLYQNLISFDKIKKLSDSLCKKAQEANELIKEFRFLSASLNTERLIRRIYDRTNYYAIASTYKDAARRENLTLLLRYASSYDKSSGRGLSGFLRYINSVFENGNDFKRMEHTKSNSDAVTITTMHSSKGLEYPFVFLCDLDKKMNIKDTARGIIVSEKLGVSFVYKDKELHLKSTPQHYEALKENYINESIAEEIRILYVAMTRAKERLFLPIYLKKDNLSKLKRLAMALTNTGFISENILRAVDGMFRWIVLPLLLNEDMTELRELSEADFGSIPHFNDEVRFTQKVFNMSSVPKKCETREEQYEEAYDDVFDLYSDYDLTLSKTPAKLSVSELAKKDTNFVFYPQIPKFSEEIGKFTAAQRGTITHSFMEICDFKNASNDLEGELDCIVNTGRLSQRKADSIDREAVKNFFESEIYSRIVKSKSVMRERAFLVRLSDIDTSVDVHEYKGTDGMLQGIADLLFEEDDGFVLVDYKTDRVKEENELIDNYTDQLLLYKAAFDLMLDKPVKSAYIYSFTLRKAIEISV